MFSVYLFIYKALYFRWWIQPVYKMWFDFYSNLHIDYVTDGEYRRPEMISREW